MSNIVAVHSWRGGTGKSTLVARLGCLLAARGLRVGLVDASLQAPGLHEALGLDGTQLRSCLWDYLSGACEIEDTHVDLAALMPAGCAGRLYLVPARTDVEVITLSSASGQYDAGLLHEGFHRLIQVLRLDLLFIDTYSGANHEAMHAIASADIDILVTRAGSAENRSATFAASIAAKVGRTPPEPLLVVNMAPPDTDLDSVGVLAGAAYQRTVAAVLPRVHDSLDDGGPERHVAGLHAGLGQLADRLLLAAPGRAG
ncbi:MAG TPA: MinD/ParA family protein [Mycobacteriales bacterium]|nr:MinD/ParA family protein [Mycobacteriales bacterium]